MKQSFIILLLAVFALSGFSQKKKYQRFGASISGGFVIIENNPFPIETEGIGVNCYNVYQRFGVFANGYNHFSAQKNNNLRPQSRSHAYDNTTDYTFLGAKMDGTPRIYNKQLSFGVNYQVIRGVYLRFGGFYSQLESGVRTRYEYRENFGHNNGEVDFENSYISVNYFGAQFGVDIMLLRYFGIHADYGTKNNFTVGANLGFIQKPKAGMKKRRRR